MHPLLREFLEYRKTIKRRSKRSHKKSFCGSPKNRGKKRMGSPHECLKRGYGMSNHTFIKDLDKFFKMKDF
jgi:hypothetical protein